MSHPISNVVSADWVLEQKQAAGVVDCQRPEHTGWYRKRECYGIILSTWGIKDLASWVFIGLIVDDFTRRKRCRNEAQILYRQTHRSHIGVPSSLWGLSQNCSFTNTWLPVSTSELERRKTPHVDKHAWNRRLYTLAPSHEIVAVKMQWGRNHNCLSQSGLWRWCLNFSVDY